MQVGAENRKKTIAAVALMALAVVLFVVRLLPSSSPAAAAPAAVSPAIAPEPTAHVVSGGRKTSRAPRSLDPTLRFDWLKITEDIKYEGTGRNIFRAEVEIPKPIAPVVPAHPDVPSGPPPPPPINLKFFGFANKPGEPRKVFLSQGEDVFIAKEGDIIDRRYRILRITPVAVEVEDVLNNNRQSIPLTQG
jgi:hypothetical protein